MASCKPFLPLLVAASISQSHPPRCAPGTRFVSNSSFLGFRESACNGGSCLHSLDTDVAMCARACVGLPWCRVYTIFPYKHIGLPGSCYLFPSLDQSAGRRDPFALTCELSGRMMNLGHNRLSKDTTSVNLYAPQDSNSVLCESQLCIENHPSTFYDSIALSIDHTPEKHPGQRTSLMKFYSKVHKDTVVTDPDIYTPPNPTYELVGESAKVCPQKHWVYASISSFADIFLLATTTPGACGARCRCPPQHQHYPAGAILPFWTP